MTQKQKTPVTVSTIVEVTERAVCIDVIVIPCSRNNTLILSPKDASLSRTSSMVCLTLETYVWVFFQFCDSISSIVCFTAFKSSSLLYIATFVFRISRIILNFFYFFAILFYAFILRYYLTVDPVWFVRFYHSLKFITYQDQYFVIFLVF